MDRPSSFMLPEGGSYLMMSQEGKKKSCREEREDEVTAGDERGKESFGRLHAGENVQKNK